MRITVIIAFLLFSLTSKAQTDLTYNYEYALIEANRQKSIGNLNEAINLYSKCLSVKPESGIAAYELGNIYAALNDLDKAMDFFTKAYVSDPENYWYMLAYIEILRIKENYNEAQNVILSYLERKEDSEIRYSLAGIYEKQNNFKQALKQLEIIEVNSGISESIVLKRAGIYKKQNKIDKGEKELQRLKEYIPESADYYILRAEYLNEAGLKDRAAVLFQMAYDLDSTNLYAITNLADYHIQNKDFEKGFSYLDKAFADPDILLENKVNTILYYLENKAVISNYTIEIERLVNSLLILYPNDNTVARVAYDFYSKTEKFDKAFLQIKKLLKQERDNYNMWQQTIYYASMLGLNEEMLNLANEAIAIFPNKTDLYLFEAIGYYLNNDYIKCYDILKEKYVLGLEMGVQMQFLTFLGESAYKLGYNDEAFSYFEELILLDPNNWPIMNNYSYYLSLEELNLERAEELSYKTILAEPESSVYLDTYGWILYKLKRNDEAIKYLEKATKLSDDPDVLFHYAEALFDNDMLEEACLYYKKALEAGFDQEQIKAKNSLCQ